MPFYDIREFIETLEKYGEVKKISKEVDWDLEAGAIMRRCCEEKLPAPFFLKIKDYEKGYTIFGNPLASFRRLAIALDMDPDASYSEILRKFDEGRKNVIKPNLVKDAPCKENIHIGDEVDLYEFPAPLIHHGDGGRYLCTWNINVTKDPDSNWINWGTYRAMIHTKDMMGGLVIPTQHIGIMYYQKYEPRNMPMPFAIAIGIEPVTALVATSGVPYGISETDIIGGIRGEPISVVKCETNDLMVPATSEIVIEGEMPPYERMEEGPFGEYTGYQAKSSVPRPIYHVKAITHRNNPILTASCMGTALDDCDVITNISFAADARTALIEAGFPIVDIYIPPEFCELVVVVSTKTPYAGIANQIAGCIWSCKSGRFLSKVIVVGEDVDIFDIREVLHAFSTIHHPVRGTQIINPSPVNPLAPYLSPSEKGIGYGANIVFDCTWPTDWKENEIPKKASFKNIYPKDIQDKVLEKWKSYGFKER
jgi:4-hydroxy-3-polyprenylbenzoate decarboxylase